MTPLPRWVLLAMLLAPVAAHPTDHACVRLCRARSTGPEIAGVCEHQQKLVIQSSEGRFPIQRLLRLCLIPCGSRNDGIADSLSYDNSQTCRAFRESLIRRRACSCDGLSSKNTGEHEETRWSTEIEENRLDRTGGPNALKVVHEDDAAVAAHFDIVRIGQAEEKKPTNTEITLSIGSPMEEADTSEEDPVDWDLWCMTQCDNGHGGSACNCDIIP